MTLPPLVAGFLFLGSSRKSGTTIAPVRKRCSREDYMNLSNEEKKQLVSDFLSFIKNKFPDSEFDYDLFHGLEYDQMVLSTIFTALKEAGHIRSAGYMKFRLTK
ncbi:hypothetical protein KAW38_01235 [Candidatus Micrarchaeota archaeon]|nr:hypothetical protein [Candidatus Micrarchaeota archaeon]